MPLRERQYKIREGCSPSERQLARSHPDRSTDITSLPYIISLGRPQVNRSGRYLPTIEVSGRICSLFPFACLRCETVHFDRSSTTTNFNNHFDRLILNDSDAWNDFIYLMTPNAAFNTLEYFDASKIDATKKNLICLLQDAENGRGFGSEYTTALKEALGHSSDRTLPEIEDGVSPAQKLR